MERMGTDDLDRSGVYLAYNKRKHSVLKRFLLCGFSGRSCSASADQAPPSSNKWSFVSKSLWQRRLMSPMALGSHDEGLWQLACCTTQARQVHETGFPALRLTTWPLGARDAGGSPTRYRNSWGDLLTDCKGGNAARTLCLACPCWTGSR